MSLITLDFETYYANGYTLTGSTTEEYICDDRFEVIGVAIKVDGGETIWVSGTHDEIKAHLHTYDWKNSLLLCHNMMFDGAILAWRFGIVPYIYLDTLCMARAIHGVDAGGSLKALAERYRLGEKGTEVNDAKGKMLADFTKEDLAQYGEYCMNDVFLTWLLFQKLSPDFPHNELKLIDMTIRMYTQPVLEVDDAMLIERLEDVQSEKSDLLKGLMARLECSTEEDVRAKLASNKQFAELLIELGVEPPMKTSPATGKETYALAKNDVGFIELQEHEDPFIQQLCAVRLGTKSTMEESRIKRFIDIGMRNKGLLPIPLKYYGAHTGRWAGTDKVNFQNLPSRDKKKKALKNAIGAPSDKVIINCDSSQIEARVLVWLAGQDNIVQLYREGRDVYSEFASKVYERPITKADQVERFVGKTCILGLGFGTGALKLQHTLKTSPPFVELSETECQTLVRIYREVNYKVVELWGLCDRALKDLANWPLSNNDNPMPNYYLGEGKCLLVTPDGIRLPNGLYIKYPELRWDTEDSKGKYMYKSRRGMVSIWGGSVVENVVQALARIIVGEQMININEEYRPILTVHDAVVCIAPKEGADEALKYIMKEMSTPPEWGKDLPISCEGKYADNYGGC